MMSLVRLLVMMIVMTEAVRGQNTVNVRFDVDASTIVVGPNGLYVGGEMFGGAMAHALTDPDGDGVYSVTVEVEVGTDEHYSFINSPEDDEDWTGRENLNLMSCGDEDHYYGRYFDEDVLLQPDDPIVVSTCFGTCCEACTAQIQAGDCDCQGNQFDVVNVCGGLCATQHNGSCTGYGMCESGGDCVQLTFHVDASTIEGGVGPNGLFVGGGVFGHHPMRLALKDDDGDGVWTVSLPVTRGLTGYYKVFNSPNDEADFASNENLVDKSCGDPNHWHARSLAPVNGDTTVELCFESCCTTCDAAPPAGDCDCDGHQNDALGVCGGSCLSASDDESTCEVIDICEGDAAECEMLTFKLHASSIEGGVDPNGNGLYVGGGVLGHAMQYPMWHASQGDLYKAKLRVNVGFEGHFIFLNNPQTENDWAAKEIIGGMACSDPTSNDDRSFGPVTGNTVVSACFGTCCANCNMDPPAGDCDCDGHQFDAVGMCGGGCSAATDDDPPTCEMFNLCDSANDADCVELTFEVHTASLPDGVDPNGNGIYLAGGVFGSNTMAYSLTNQGDDLWSISLRVNDGFSGNYKFFNNPQTENDHSGKEHLNGLSCATNNNMRHLDAIHDDTIVQACFGTCDCDCHGNALNAEGVCDGRCVEGHAASGTCAKWNVCTESDASQCAEISFQLHVKDDLEVGANGMYVGGGVLGNAMAFPMLDPDGDGTWDVTVVMSKGTNGHYIYLNSPESEVDWTAKEHLEGLSCADADSYNDRYFGGETGVQADTTMHACFGTCCETCDAAIPPGACDCDGHVLDAQDVCGGNCEGVGSDGQCNVFGTCADGDDCVDVTFQLDTSNVQVGPNGMYVGGGVLGDARAYRLSHESGDTWRVTVQLPSGISGNYVFLNSPDDEEDWSAKEHLSGLGCADASHFNDRVIGDDSDAGLTTSTTLSACFDSCCSDCDATPPPGTCSCTGQVADVAGVCGGDCTTVDDSDGSCALYDRHTPGATYHDVTFELHVASDVTIGDDGLFVGAGILGNARRYPLWNRGHGKWSATVRVDHGFTGNFAFLNAPENEADWTAKEHLGGQACADAGHWNDRTLPQVTEDTTIVACFSSCAVRLDECGVCDGAGIPSGYCDCDGTPDGSAACGNSPDHAGSSGASTAQGTTVAIVVVAIVVVVAAAVGAGMFWMRRRTTLGAYAVAADDDLEVPAQYSPPGDGYVAQVDHGDDEDADVLGHAMRAKDKFDL